MKNKKILIVIILIILSVLLIFVLKIKQSKKSLNFPPAGVLCFDNFMEVSKNGYADGFRIPSFELKNISYFRCASIIGFSQYEVEGIDNEGHKFYIHKDEGGMAASGSDGVYNLCYKKDDYVITKEAMYGRDLTKKEGTCYWTDNFITNPTSSYKYYR